MLGQIVVVEKCVPIIESNESLGIAEVSGLPKMVVENMASRGIFD